MARFTHPPVDAAHWSARLEPDEATDHAVRYATPRGATELTPCGVDWDAVVLAPLERGLRCLDLLGLPLTGGHSVIADYARSELVVLIAVGTGDAVADLSGVRVLGRGSWLVVPRRGRCALAAVWLSEPGPTGYVETTALRAALVRADAERVEFGQARIRAAVEAAQPCSAAPPR